MITSENILNGNVDASAHLDKIFIFVNGPPSFSSNVPKFISKIFVIPKNSDFKKFWGYLKIKLLKKHFSQKH